MRVDLNNADTVTYSNLLEDARNRSLWAKRRTFGGWTKEQRCVLVLKEIFERFKEVNPGTTQATIARADLARRALTKVLLNDVLPKVGPVAASLVVGRKDEMKVFFELLTKSQHLEKVEPSLGAQTNALQWINADGQNGASRPGYASIWNMNNEQIKACRASLAKFAEKLDAITDETCVLLGYVKDDLYQHLGIARAQLDAREARLKQIASLLPGRLRRFAADARKRLKWIGGDAAITQTTLQTTADSLKTDLNLVGSLYKGKTDADIMKISAQMDDFIDFGFVSQRKGAEDDDFRQPILRGTDVLVSVISAFVGPGLINLATSNTKVQDAAGAMFPYGPWGTLASGVVGLVASSYFGNGSVASLFM